MTTKEASKIIGKSPAHLTAAIYTGYFPAPERRGKSYDWSPKDIKNAKQYFYRKGKK